MKHKLLYHFFSDDDFLRITKRITEAEKTTSGEIRVAMKESKPSAGRNKDIRDLAVEEFVKLNMHATRDKTGILLYLLLKERQFHILADSGINEKVNPSTWDNLRDKIQTEFKNGKFTEGILICISEVGEILSSHFPIKPDDTNELSNRVVLE